MFPLQILNKGFNFLANRAHHTYLSTEVQPPPFSTTLSSSDFIIYLAGLEDMDMLSSHLQSVPVLIADKPSISSSLVSSHRSMTTSAINNHARVEVEMNMQSMGM